ncbi:MAG: HD domain-containing protein [Firmicutes bacterium]|jgi:predicted HD superfamily hydrolase involved in NAD metabolism|nr:HD domain-containing protein [Bacillota bacterium]HPU01453.1 bis(5'-nucleosyl)-tetraphosphatase (symmetrical) YqeK [Bacillota bacterium]
MDLKRYRKLMEEHLGEELYRHSLGVAETAERLAGRYRADCRRAYLAGLLHDYGKACTREELCRKAELYGLQLDRITLAERRLLHAPVGAALLRHELGLSDPAVLRAVAYHTTGHEKMSLLDKVIYLADMIEPGRDFGGVEKLRELAQVSLDAALLAAVNLTIASVIRRGFPLHPRSVYFRNSLLAGLKEKENGG